MTQFREFWNQVIAGKRFIVFWSSTHTLGAGIRIASKFIAMLKIISAPPSCLQTNNTRAKSYMLIKCLEFFEFLIFQF